MQVVSFRPLGVCVPVGPISRAQKAFSVLLFGPIKNKNKLHIKAKGRMPLWRSRWRMSAIEPERGTEVTRHPTLPGMVSQHLLLGVSLAFVREFAMEQCVGPTEPTYAVAAEIRSQTAETGSSIAEQVSERRTKNGMPAVAQANLFVSHAQSCSFLKMLEAIDAHLELHDLDPATTFLWLGKRCSLACHCCRARCYTIIAAAPNAATFHDDARRTVANLTQRFAPPDLLATDVFCIRQNRVARDVMHIGTIERMIGNVVMVLDPWHEPVCLSRVW